ncbi:hypothetical protein ABT288_11760 [Streptomyces sp. NPDC001093]|uniref:hypothetical protein n=1 Tax=Streptomyces sp. NPDC001093 TaxID=3154376 RepID=UPI00331C2BAE
MASRNACARPGPRLFLGCLVGAGESAAVPTQLFLQGSQQERLEAVVGMRPVPAGIRSVGYRQGDRELAVKDQRLA